MKLSARLYSPTRALLIAVVSSIALFLYHQWATALSTAEVSFPEFPDQPEFSYTTELPDHQIMPHEPTPMLVQYTLHFKQHFYESRLFIAQADNAIHSITLNGTELPEDATQIEGNIYHPDCGRTCHFYRKIIIRPAPELFAPDNELTITLYSDDGAYGLALARNISRWQLLGYGLILAATLWALRRLQVCRGSAGLLLWASLPYFLFWWLNFPDLAYTNDVHGHMRYILHMRQFWWAPYAFSGWQSWQQPSYYFIAAQVMNIADSLGLQGFHWIRFFSIPLYLGFSYFGVRTLHLAIPRASPHRLAAECLIIFWPVCVLMATRINNDIPVYPLWAASFYFALRWYHEHQPRDLFIAIVWLAACFAFKSNAVIPGAIIGLMVLYAITCRQCRLADLIKRPIPWCIPVLMAGLFINCGRILYEIITAGSSEKLEQYFGPPIGGSPALHHYLHFDLGHFLAHPFSVFESEPSFWNYFLKTMLYGEFKWPLGAATLMNALLVATLVIALLVTAISLVRHPAKRWWLFPHMVAVGVSIVAVMLQHYTKPWAACQDFRYVLPMLVALAVLYTHGMESIERRWWSRPLYIAGLFAGFALPTGMVWFYLISYLE